jgi:hypothetical protein
MKFHSIQTKQFFYSKISYKNLGCYKLPPLKEISSLRFGEARKKDGFGIPRWATTLKRNFCG